MSGVSGVPPGTLPGLLDELARVHGDAPALIDGDVTVGFTALACRVRRLAAGLAALGTGPGDVVAVWLPNSTMWVEAAFAGARRGATVLGVNTKYRSHEVRQALHDSRARVLVTWPGFHGIDFLGMLTELAGDLPDSLEHVVVVGGDLAPGGLPAALRDRLHGWDDLFGHGEDAGSLAEPDAAGNAFSSSGSTAAPKLVLHRQRGMTGHARDVAAAYGYTAPDAVLLGALPFCGVFGFNTLLAGLAAGRPVVVQAVFDGAHAAELMRRHAVTHANLADEMLRRILAAAGPDLAAAIPSWREAAFGNFTATDPAELVAAGDAAGKRFFQTYGASEVMALMCYPPAGADAARRAVGGGVPVSPEITFRISDPETGAPVPYGTAGEIEIAGPTVTAGYLNRDGIADLGADGYFRTGDLGHTPDGRDLVFLSRRGDALRLGGFLVSPREIEAFLEELPGVAAAQVVGAGTAAGTVPVAFVVPRTEAAGGAPAAVDEEEIIARCRERLASFKVPRRVLTLAAFPLAEGANGDKIQRTRLRELAAEALAASEGPRDRA